MMSSLWGLYIKERLNKEMLETAGGFATYYFVPDKMAVYVEDVFVKKEMRQTGIASYLVNEISLIAKKNGMNKVFVTVQPSSNGSTACIQAIIAYGFKLSYSTNDAILFVREI